MKMKLFYAIIFFVVGIFSNLCFAQSDEDSTLFRKITFTRNINTETETYDAKIGDYKLSLLNPDNPKSPDVWDSKVIISNINFGTTCESEEQLLITQVYALENAELLLIESYSGSMTYIDYIDIRTCETKYETLKLYTEKILYENDKIVIYPSCECSEPEKPCLCNAGMVIDFDSGYRPVHNIEKSRKLTKRIIGISFDGIKEVYYPKTTQVKLKEN